MLKRKFLVVAGMVLCLAACGKGASGDRPDKPGGASGGNAVFVDTSSLSEFKDVAGSILSELKKQKGIRLVEDRKEATIYLGINAIVPQEVNEATNNNYIVLSYLLVNYDTRNTTQGLGMGQRNLLDPFSANVAGVVNDFVRKR